MTRTTKIRTEPESPARRLGILYIASFCMIALLSGISQLFILREMTWQGDAISAVGAFARGRSPARPLGVSALAALEAGDPAGRAGREGALREAIARGRREPPWAAKGSDTRAASDGLEGRVSPNLRRADKHRLAAIKAADALLALLTRAGPAAPPPAEVWPLALRVAAEEGSHGQAVADAALVSEREAVDRIRRLKAFDLELFGLVMIVLLLEGLYVVNPAVKKIQAFVGDMARSHNGMKVYAAKLERSNKELQDFASVASHDLQEPLRKVQAFSDRLKSKCAASIDDQGRDYLDRIQNASKRMQTLINDLLTYARVSTKAQPFVTADLVTITREVVSDLETRIEQTDGRVEVGAMPSVEADPLQFRQLMQNLIGNSLKYKRPDVPPVVKVSGRHFADDPSVPRGVATGPVCQIAIEDNGIGFDEVYTDRIFTIFQRLHGRNEYEGTGVGLAVCRKIVERHGGTITARSTPGTGSTFLVTLPVHQPKETAPDGRTP